MTPSLQNPLNDTPIANDSKYAQDDSPPTAVIVSDPQVFGQFVAGTDYKPYNRNYELTLDIFVADRLQSVRDVRKRRKLELFIQEAIINVQKEEIE